MRYYQIEMGIFDEDRGTTRFEREPMAYLTLALARKMASVLYVRHVLDYVTVVDTETGRSAHAQDCDC